MTTAPIGRLNVFLLLTVIVFWGSSFVVVKIAINEGLTPIAVATSRFLIAGGLFVAALIIKRTQARNYRLLVERKDIPVLVLLALTGVTFFFIAQYTGIQMAGASIASILVTLLSPIIIAVFSTRMLNERLTRKQTVGIGIAAIGTLAVILGGNPNLNGNTQFLYGSLILLATPVLWAAYNLVGKKTLEKYDPFLVAGYVTVIGGLALIPFAFADNALSQIASMSSSSWLAILFLAVACSLFGYFIWFYVLKQIGATVTSSFLFIEPLVTVLLAATLVGEQLSLYTAIGGVLIFLGVRLITRNKLI